VLDDLHAEILDADTVQTPRLAWGARAIAAYLGKPERWLRRQLERAKAPPPTFRIGSAIVVDLDALDLWLSGWCARADSKQKCAQL
jgi:hypothetical protein